MTATTPTSFDPAELEAFLGRFVGDMGAAMTMPLVALGDRLGLYRAMDAAGPVTPAELATRAGIAERYAREWLANQAASGYVTYDADDGTYTLPAAHAAALADEDSPFYLLGVCDIIEAMHAGEDRMATAFATGRGLGWGDQDPRLFRGTERFFRPGYQRDLVGSWIPALDGVADRLEQGIRVADVGCGHGASTLLMAEEYPASRFVGWDLHEPSIERARAAAVAAGVEDRTTFAVAGAADIAGGPYDLICLFDCLHDMGDPVGVARHLYSCTAPGGSLMLVEPFATDRVEENLTPVGRAFYAASTLICCPNAIDQGGAALGAQAGPARLADVLHEAGYATASVAAETPFNLVIHARP